MLPLQTIFKIFLVILTLSLLGACAPLMRGSVVIFYEDLLPNGESIRVEAMDPEVGNTLEFRHYAALLEQELRSIGYIPVADPTADVQLIAEIATQSQLPVVMPYQVTALFTNFPGESGIVKMVTIEMDE